MRDIQVILRFCRSILSCGRGVDRCSRHPIEGPDTRETATQLPCADMNYAAGAVGLVHGLIHVLEKYARGCVGHLEQTTDSRWISRPPSRWVSSSHSLNTTPIGPRLRALPSPGRTVVGGWGEPVSLMR